MVIFSAVSDPQQDTPTLSFSLHRAWFASKFHFEQEVFGTTHHRSVLFVAELSDLALGWWLGFSSSGFYARKPYILLARHHWMREMEETNLPRSERFNEMVVYPQVQDALFFGQPMRLSDIRGHIDQRRFSEFDYNQALNRWNIKRNQETVQDFQRHNESAW